MVKIWAQWMKRHITGSRRNKSTSRTMEKGLIQFFFVIFFGGCDQIENNVGQASFDCLIVTFFLKRSKFLKLHWNGGKWTSLPSHPSSFQWISDDIYRSEIVAIDKRTAGLYFLFLIFYFYPSLVSSLPNNNLPWSISFRWCVPLIQRTQTHSKSFMTHPSTLIWNVVCLTHSSYRRGKSENFQNLK